MADSPDLLAPPGSSSYSSNTMSVGDGTWDAQRNTFLLPNLVGLNFDTMRYNGMGNRFRDVPEYHSLVRGHGILAAITFLAIVPAAIMIVRFYDRRPFWAVRLHIWLQIMTVMLTTVLFVLGWFAVGPNRSLTNPHHGMGVAIYVLILVQAFGGWFAHGRKHRRTRRRTPLKIVLHHWFGRLIALLGIIQVALGLTLYGSPVALFVLYALTVFTLLLTYFILSHRHESYYDERGRSHNHASESVDDRSSRHGGGLGALATAGVVGAGLAALRGHRSRSRSRRGSRGGTDNVVGSRRHSYVEEEKYSDRDTDHGKWTNRLLKAGAVVGAVALARKFFGDKKDRDQEYDETVSGETYSDAEETNISRVEQGRGGGGHRRTSIRRTNSSSSLSARTEQTRGHGIRDGIATLGAFGFLKSALNSRKERKESKRAAEIREHEMKEERLARAGSKRARYTGDGNAFPARGGRRGSLTGTSDLSQTSDGTDLRPRRDPGIPPPLPAGMLPAAAGGAAVGGAAALSGRNRRRDASNANLGLGPVDMPPAPPDPQGILHHDSSGSEAYEDDGGRRHHRHHSSQDAAMAGVLAGGLASRAGESSRRSRRDHSVDSPPVSVKVNVRDAGRNVTLRRLTEEEAAAERERRRDSRNRSSRQHRRRDSGSDAEDGDRWRRVESMERRQANEGAADQRGDVLYPNLPPPPPIRDAGNLAGPGSVTSPGTVTTEASRVSRSQRRRAERSSAAAHRGGNTTEYS
ncbi:MAG: hypothetical protein M1829_003663 [Trizodia sp. TS-e1964]|nr:MAG: hypothetical protein M1829_003663 [Trizodia sp. TS-e1964]